MDIIKKIAAIAALCALAACGGGGDDGSEHEAQPAAVDCSTNKTDPFCVYDNPKPVIKPGG